VLYREAVTRAEQIRAWRDRWFTVSHADIEQIRTDLLAGRTIRADVFGEVNGRADLRGLPLTRLKLARVTAGDDTAWDGLDLSGADLYEMNWRELTIRDCVLDDADVDNLRCWGVTVTGTSLRRARLSAGQLGASPEFWAKPSRWEDVDLRQADLRGSHADAVFTKVDFRNAKLTGMDFRYSDLVDCVFAGVVKEVTFGGTQQRPPNWQLSGVDFTEAKPRAVAFTGVNLGQPDVDIRLPEDADHWLIPDWPGFLKRVGLAVQRLPEGELKMAAEIWHEEAEDDSGPYQTTGFITTSDLNDIGGHDLVAFLSHLR
jgi:uncharacterized protein YjbI with pentapeptide repeats